MSPLLLDLAGCTRHATTPNGENDNTDCGVVARANGQLVLSARIASAGRRA